MSSATLASRIRLHTLKMIHSAKSSHIASCFSVTDILAVLYNDVMNYDSKNPTWEDRDRFILSKGHAAAAVYAVLAEKGFIPIDYLSTYGKNGTKLQGHLSHSVPGVEISTGSLGHGLPIACGMALAAKNDKKNYRIYVVLSDGECDEGSIWEAAMFAGHHQLYNLTVIIDNNKFQACGRTKDILDLEPFAQKWQSFNWNVSECDGHHHQTIKDCIYKTRDSKKLPSVIIAHTIKGKGVSFMEDKLLWHYRSPDEVVFAEAVKELEGAI